MNELSANAARIGKRKLSDIAASRAGRPISAPYWSMDTARQYLDEKIEDALIEHAESRNLAGAIARLFNGDIVNPSENRPALHWALRDLGSPSGEANGVRQSMSAPLQFARDMQAEKITTFSGETFNAVLHIGIGGSDFGPRLIADAFADKASPDIALRFCANVDPFDLERAMQGLDPTRTLVIGVSKSFGTEETLYNLGRALKWLEAKLGDNAARHLALVTANPDRATKWLGGRKAYLFDMPLSVGGRFSLWSAASLGCMISLGADTFEALLEGAYEMDQHVQNADIGDNVPMLLAILDYWNATVRGETMRVALAYSNRLRMLPTYLQQLEMESNGKSVSPQGEEIDAATAPALWGGEGSVGQHSYHQWLHQGTNAVPTEFVLALDKGAEPDGQTALIAHCLAQAEVLANGRSLEEVNAEEPGLPEAIARQKVHPGNRPSTLLTCTDFSPQALGALIALYEHRTYLSGLLWGVNSFDQWGVERGKTMAGRLKPVLRHEVQADDPVTAALVAALSK